LTRVDVELCPANDRRGKPLLDGVVDRFFGTKGQWTYWREPDTGHLWLNPRPSDEEIPALYTQYYTHGQGISAGTSTWEQAMQWARHRRLAYPLAGPVPLKAKLLSHLPSVGEAAEMSVLGIPAGERGRLLDFGCGDGRFMAQMAHLGWTVAGVEPDPAAVRTIKDRFGFEARPSLEGADGWKQQFDVVTINHAIEHVPDPLQTIRDCAALLRPGGRMIVTTPNAESLGARLFGRHWRGLEPPRHLNVFTGASLSDVVTRAGLRVERMATATRLARGIFFASVWASRGRERIELDKPGGTAVKLAGYLFQVLEGALATGIPSLGEELVCVARTGPREE
jgi:2-polyprenyl-3-methyl-5-hydroxy-6-metoxy-1,4-benzoquinol methylase